MRKIIFASNNKHKLDEVKRIFKLYDVLSLKDIGFDKDIVENLKTLKNGDYVNIEVDMIAKYIEKFLSSSDNKSKISLEFLQEHGF